MKIKTKKQLNLPQLIKFRAWDKEDKEWLSIRTIGFDDDGSLWYLQAWDDNENDIDPPYFEDDLGVKWELLQSTGLKDKNGVEIFEGDIIDCYTEGLSTVKFEHGCFGLVCNGYFEGFENVLGKLEIIGNQFEHPHLLKE